MAKRFKQIHYHLYLKRPFPSGKLRWVCVKSGCNHYRHAADMVGREAECWYCHKPFIIYQKVLHNAQAKPHCVNCNSPHRFGAEAKKKKEELNKLTGDNAELDKLLESKKPRENGEKEMHTFNLDPAEHEEDIELTKESENLPEEGEQNAG